MRMHARAVLDYSTTAVILATCVFLVWANSNKIWPSKTAIPKASQSLQGAALKGNPNAPIVLIEYSDYQCPFCAKAERETLPELNQDYIRSGQVQLAFRHHPLSRIHPLATKAAEAAVCAGRLGKFWEMHAALFANPKQLDEKNLLARAKEIGLDEGRFSACLSMGEGANQVRSDVQSAEALKLSGTPAFLVGRRESDGRVRVLALLTGSQPFNSFSTAIDDALNAGRYGVIRTSWISAIIAIVVIAGAIGIVQVIRRRGSVVPAGASL